MMSFKKTLAALAATAAMAVAQAAPVTVGGVTFDPDSRFDFTGTSAQIFQNIDPATGVLSGYGYITSINNTTRDIFAPNGELTFTFSGYTPTGAGSLNFTGGVFNVYYDTSRDANNGNALTQATAENGSLWLALAGRTNASGFTLQATDNRALNGSVGGQGLLDVTGGVAAGNLNTNSQVGGADLAFSSSFTTFFNSTQSFGTANFNGNSIPEPASLALVGLGLLGVAAARRKSAKK